MKASIEKEENDDLKRLLRARNDLWIMQLGSHGDLEESRFHGDSGMTSLMEGSQKRMGSEESDRVPKTTPRLSNLLRVLTELSTVVLTSMIYCSERMPKINKAQGARGETRHKLSRVLSQWSHTECA